MDVREFAENLKEIISEKEGSEVTVQEVTKNNGISLMGLMIREDDVNAAPTIYVDSFLEAYEKQGVSLERIADKILEIYHADKPKHRVNMSFFRDFEKVRDGICYMLVNREANKELLKKIPYVEFLDMAICFYYDFYNRNLGAGKILIYNSHMEMWGVTVDELLGVAKENNIVRKPVKIWAMSDIIREMQIEAGGRESDLMFDDLEDDMMVISNDSRTNGAAVILYAGVLKDIAETKGADLILLPSSIHEFIVMVLEERESLDYLKNMVREVNRTQVEPEEVLSENIYIYSRASEKISIA